MKPMTTMTTIISSHRSSSPAPNGSWDQENSCRQLTVDDDFDDDMDNDNVDNTNDGLAKL